MAIVVPKDGDIISAGAFGIPVANEVNRMTPLVVITAWVAFTLQGAWSTYPGEQPMQYRKVGDMVQIRGFITGGAGNTVCATLPVGFRPPTNSALGGLAYSGSRVMNRLGITTLGAISPELGLPTEIFGQEFSITV